MAPHFPMNSESESEAITSSDGRPSFTDPATYIPQGNDESESDSPYSTTTTTTKQQAPPQQANQFEQRGRNRLQAGGGGNESDGEEDRAGGDGGIRKPYVRSRSKTPRGASSRSRSRGPGNKLNANNQSSYVPRTVLPINSESEDPTTSASTSEAEDPSSNFTGHVAQNSGSDTDGAGGGGSLGVSSGRQGGRAEGRSQGGGGGGGVGGSRSRSRGRVPQYDVVLNSESESDFVEGGEREEVQQSGGAGARRERIGISLNSESEQE